MLLWITGAHCLPVSNRKGKDDKGSTWCTFPWYLQNSNSSYTGCHRDPSGSVHLLWSIPAQTWLFDCTHDPPVLKHPASVSGVQQKVAFPVKSESGSYISWHLQVLPLHQVKIRHKEIYQVVVWLAGSEPRGILPASWSSWPWIMQTQCKQPAKEQRGIWTITEDVYGETNTSIRYVGTLKYD